MSLPLHSAPSHPGEFLADFLEDLGLSQTAFAQHLGQGWTQSKVNQIIKGKRGITPETALAFSDAFGNSPEFWLNAQKNMSYGRPCNIISLDHVFRKKLRKKLRPKKRWQKSIACSICSCYKKAHSLGSLTLILKI